MRFVSTGRIAVFLSHNATLVDDYKAVCKGCIEIAFDVEVCADTQSGEVLQV